jgi:hypothetical protein
MLQGFDDERRLAEVQRPLTPPPPLKEIAQPFEHFDIGGRTGSGGKT